MHGQYLSAGWPLDRRGSARAHGGTAGGQTRASEAAARNRRASVRQHQAMDEPGRLSPAWTGEGAGRIQPDGAGLQLVNIVGVASLLKAGGGRLPASPHIL